MIKKKLGKFDDSEIVCILHSYMHTAYLHMCCATKLSQLCPALCDPINCSPPGSFVHGILQATVLEQIAVPFSMESSQPRDQTLGIIFHVSCIGRRVLYHQCHLGYIHNLQKKNKQFKTKLKKWNSSELQEDIITHHSLYLKKKQWKKTEYIKEQNTIEK